MKIAALIAALLVSNIATAQYYQIPQHRSTYDARSGNMYNVQQMGNQTNIQGYNLNNGTMWNQTQNANGTYSGIDSRGNYYQGDNRTGMYINSNGTTCIGQGAARSCF